MINCAATASPVLEPLCIASTSARFVDSVEVVPSESILASAQLIKTAAGDSSGAFVVAQTHNRSQDSDPVDERSSFSRPFVIGIVAASIVLAVVVAAVPVKATDGRSKTAPKSESGEDPRMTITQEPLLDFNDAIMDGTDPSASSFRQGWSIDEFRIRLFKAIEAFMIRWETSATLLELIAARLIVGRK
jgi:hypothetical protein